MGKPHRVNSIIHTGGNDANVGKNAIDYQTDGVARNVVGEVIKRLKGQG